MQNILISIVFILITSGSVCRPLLAQTNRDLELPSTPEGELASEFLDVISQPDPEAWRAFVVDHYAEKFRSIAPVETHVTILQRTYDRNRGFTVRDYEFADESMTVAAQSRLTGAWNRLIFRFTDEESPQLTGLGIRAGLPPAGESPRRISPLEFYDELDGFLDRLVDADAFSGTVVIAKDGRIRFARAFGEADKAHGVPNHVDTRFSLGSMNKMVTAVAIAQLVERGRIRFDDPLSKYLPRLPNPQAAEQIRLNHLLSHTSGLGDFLGEAAARPANSFSEVDDFVELVEGDTLQFPPAEKWSYSNAGFLVLGKVIEEVTDSSYYDYVEENIYEVAGMDRAGSDELSSVIDGLAIGYEKEYTESGPRYRNNRFAIGLRGSPAGGGYATALDLVQFADALRAGKLVARPLVDSLTTPKPRLGSDRYGYGFSLRPARGIVGHSGGFTGVGANMDIFREEDLTAVVLSNYGGGSGAVVTKIRELVDRLEVAWAPRSSTVYPRASIRATP